MLRTKLFQAFALLVIAFGLLSGLFGIRIIKKRIIDEAQNQVSLDLGSAWALFDSKLHDIRTIIDLVVIKKAVVDAAAEKVWASDDLQHRLENIRTSFGLDFLTVVSPEGQVVMRASPPYNIGDFQGENPAVLRAMKGEHVSGITVMSSADLSKESPDLLERAFLVYEPTQRARPTPKTQEERGMVMISAAPILKGPQLMGVIYAGVLLNRNFGIVDRITETIYKNETYKGSPIGTATIFLGDCRIATTVRLPNGNRAIGTRASKEVADRVLDNATPWVGPAFVVRDSYLTAYDPIRDMNNEVIGMLYVGRLERPFKEMGRSFMLRYGGISLIGLAAALLLALIVAGRLANPVHQLVEASERMHRGEGHTPIQAKSSCREIEELVVAFNEMAAALDEREGKLTDANEALTGLNRSYMDMLGFVSHELKSPISSIMNYVFLLRQHKIGQLTEPQEKAVRNIETNSKRIVEMVRHYLNLSRIENGELQPVFTRVAVLDEVVKPLLETFESDIASHHMRVENAITPDIALRADLNMAREVFENLVSNAIKYGRDNTPITIGCKRLDGMVHFSVRNEGPGIPADKIKAVFQKFTRLESDQHIRRQRGTGLGLFITEHIIKAHGGTIDVDSRPQEWVEFRFTMPVFKEEEKT